MQMVMEVVQLIQQIGMQLTQGYATNVATATITGYQQVDAARALKRKTNGRIGVGVRAFIGVEYFVAPKVSIGGEFGWGVGYQLNTKDRFLNLLKNIINILMQRHLVDAAKGYETHLTEGGKMMVTLAGAMSTAELRKIFSRNDSPREKLISSLAQALILKKIS
jgi:hypothetical protein